MPQQVADRRDQDFVIWEQLNCEEILKHETYREFNKKTCDMILKEARALAIKELLPLMAEGDEQGVTFDSGVVKVPQSFHRVYKLIQEGEWNNLSVPEEMGGQGAPAFVGAAAAEFFLGAGDDPVDLSTAARTFLHLGAKRRAAIGIGAVVLCVAAPEEEPSRRSQAQHQPAGADRELEQQA